MVQLELDKSAKQRKMKFIYQLIHYEVLDFKVGGSLLLPAQSKLFDRYVLANIKFMAVSQATNFPVRLT